MKTLEYGGVCHGNCVFFTLHSIQKGTSAFQLMIGNKAVIVTTLNTPTIFIFIRTTIPNDVEVMVMFGINQ